MSFVIEYAFLTAVMGVLIWIAFNMWIDYERSEDDGHTEDS